MKEERNSKYVKFPVRATDIVKYYLLNIFQRIKIEFIKSSSISFSITTFMNSKIFARDLCTSLHQRIYR